jgi:DNA-binding protein YbaB
MSGLIEPRYGAEVYVSDTGHVCIKQTDPVDEKLVVFHPDEIEELVILLEKAVNEAYEARRGKSSDS